MISKREGIRKEGRERRIYQGKEQAVVRALYLVRGIKLMERGKKKALRRVGPRGNQTHTRRAAILRISFKKVKKRRDR